MVTSINPPSERCQRMLDSWVSCSGNVSFSFSSITAQNIQFTTSRDLISSLQRRLYCKLLTTKSIYLSPLTKDNTYQQLLSQHHTYLLKQLQLLQPADEEQWKLAWYKHTRVEGREGAELHFKSSYATNYLHRFSNEIIENIIFSINNWGLLILIR